MGAARKRVFEHESGLNRPKRELPPADYDDEVTEKQIEDLHKLVAPCIDSEEWVIVDGPAW